MSLRPGTQLGSYELIALIGAGGMGEVYKARDPKLNRLVAIKVLPSSLAGDPALLARFEREAKAVAALSHPNVLGIHDLGAQGGLTYAVMELLEGESLRDRLKGGALPPKRAIEIAIELAQGLGAAHERGIVHRDVKPENIFITSEGHVKVLDFGLAKQVAEPRRAMANLETEAMSLPPNGTEAGMVLGTAGYMSPEQVKGEPADHRADIFAFGVVLYEMLSGQRPFKGETAHHTMTAILDQDPPALVAARGPLPPALDRLVAHCLEKNPKARFQSMHDLAYDLQNLSAPGSGAVPGLRPRPRGLRPLLGHALTAAAVLLLVGVAAALRLPPFGPPAQPDFQRITVTPGTVDTARFGPDGRTIYFSQRVKGGLPELFVLHPDTPEPKPLGITDAQVLAVSAGNELAVLRHPVVFFSGLQRGTLAQVAGSGGQPKEIQEGALEAVWDGQALATLATDEYHAKTILQFAGRTLLEAPATDRALVHLTLARDGSRLALVDADLSSKSELVSYDRAGHRDVLLTLKNDVNGHTITGLVWGPGGELWCSELQGDQTAVWTLGPKGTRRVHWRGPGQHQLMDISPEGRMLLCQQQIQMGVLVQRKGQAQPLDLSIRGGTQVWGLSSDGQTLLLMESPILDGGTTLDRAYLLKLDGSPPVLLERGSPRSLSRDGRWAHVDDSMIPPEDLDPAVASALREAGAAPGQAHLLLVPTGAGRPRAVALPAPIESPDWVQFHPDGQRLFFFGNEKGHSDRWFCIDGHGQHLRPVTPEGWGVASGSSQLSPDGSSIFLGNGKQYAIQSVEGGEPRIILGLNPVDRVKGFAEDARTVFVHGDPSRMPLVFLRLTAATGSRQPVASLTLPDPAGFQFFRGTYLTPDGATVAATYMRRLSQLYLVEGVQ